MKYQTDLFEVHTVLKEFHGHCDVIIKWFRCEKPEIPLIPYTEAIRDYVPGKHPYAEGAIDELFSRVEAEQVAAYLDKYHGDEGRTTIKKRDLPIDNNAWCIRATPVGSGPDCYMLWKEPKYTVPFQVEGFFDLRN